MTPTAFPLVVEKGMPRLSEEVTAFDLLDIVKEIVRRDPRCFNSMEWISSCGTVACIAGWMVLLTRGALEIDTLSRMSAPGPNAGDIASDILGLGWGEVEDLFHPCGLTGGTDTEGAIARITAFQRQHEAWLRAQWVDPASAQWAVEARWGA